ncbi:hypothetical protein [Streptomyces sp. NPDC002491]
MTNEATETTADRFGLTNSRRASGLAGLARKSVPHPAADALSLDALPDPDASASDTPELSDAERADYALCERAARTHHASFWLTGKALDAVAQRHLYRATYATFDELLEDWGITLADSSRMRRGWRLAARLLPDVPKLTVAHVEALLPVVQRYDMEAAVTLYAMLREAVPRVTGRVINDIVRELPGSDDDESPVAAIRAQAERLLTDPADVGTKDPAPEDISNDDLRRAVDQRARQLANDLKRSRIPRPELARTLTAAFADPDDPQVYRALLRWMRAHNR